MTQRADAAISERVFSRAFAYDIELDTDGYPDFDAFLFDFDERLAKMAEGIETVFNEIAAQGRCFQNWLEPCMSAATHPEMLSDPSIVRIRHTANDGYALADVLVDGNDVADLVRRVAADYDTNMTPAKNAKAWLDAHISEFPLATELFNMDETWIAYDASVRQFDAAVTPDAAAFCLRSPIIAAKELPPDWWCHISLVFDDWDV